METSEALMLTAVFSAAFAIVFGVLGPAIGIARITQAGMKAVHYQPAKAMPVMKNMLIGMAITESSAIFALVTAMTLLFSPFETAGWEKIYALAGAGICIGLGTFGSGIGEGMIAEKAVENIARSPESEPAMTRLMLLTQAITESPAVFALVISLSLIFVDTPRSGMVYAISLLTAGCCMGIGTLGPAIGEGLAASRACAMVGKKPFAFAAVMRTLLLGMAITESVAVYALVISLCIMYFA